MEFKKYPSLENHYRVKFINAIEENIPSDAIWTVSEKMHGANMGIWCDGEEVKFSRRSGFIPEGEKFYQLSLIREHLETRMMEFHERFFQNGEVFTLWGELVGEGVQKGVNYTQGNAFFAFDAMVDGEFMPWDTITQEVLETWGPFNTVPQIGRGTLQECLEMENEFNSKVRAGSEDFTAEGIVIKPENPQYGFLPNGSRAAIKSKNDKFSEVSKAPKKSQPHRVITDPAVNEWVEAVSPYINENRVNAVISKEGPWERSMFGKIMNLTVLDAIEDYCKDHGKDFMLLEKQTREDIMGILIFPVREILKTL